VEIDGEPLKIPAIMPRMEGTPGRTDWPGMDIGSHNDEVLRGILNLDDAEIAQLRADGVVAGVDASA
jgi:crotonobetainyl-CoA:carnitine CoA-transferase CaiB-like acyl-CoA transferase